MIVKKILLTGATGFLGRKLLTQLQRDFPDCTIDTVSRGKIAVSENKGQHFSADLSQNSIVSEVLHQSKPDLVFHAAGKIASDTWEELHRDNVVTTVNLMESALRLESKPRLVFIGSAAEYGAPQELPVVESQCLRPTSLYGVAKTCQSQVAQVYSGKGLEICSARIFNIVGQACPTTLIFGRLLEQIVSNSSGHGPISLKVGNTWPKRDFIDVHDVASGISAIGRFGAAGESYNICSGHSVSIQDLLVKFEKELRRPFNITSTVGRSVHQEVDDIFGYYEKLKKISNWHPKISLEQSIREALRGVAVAEAYL